MGILRVLFQTAFICNGEKIHIGMMNYARELVCW
jgi:hypothetical protein